MKFNDLIEVFKKILLQNQLYQSVFRIKDYLKNNTIRVDGNNIISTISDKVGNYILLDTTGSMSFENKEFFSEQQSYSSVVGIKIWSIINDTDAKFDPIDILEDLVYQTTMIQKNVDSLVKLEISEAHPNKYETIGMLLDMQNVDNLSFLQTKHICLISGNLHYVNTRKNCEFLCTC